eukprot:TRINITY_DN4704_c0_g1_i1.p1 TRINITY_DN4704_c0_g1~~TRINITY_DN4704_c0_g1_i1.p1  ORF type:complete len:475 (-),score=44.35 TRINITY_DN4704_c0_g1_i1:204-1628(-)
MASYKNRLQEFFQKRHLDLPKYETADHGGAFACKILLSDGKSIVSSEFPNKKSAEQDAAAKALQYIEQNESRFAMPAKAISPMLAALHNMNNLAPTPPRESNPLSEISYKNLLQEFMQSRSLGTPKYSTQANGPSHSAVWYCELQIPPHPSYGNLKFVSTTYHNSKTRAEQDAARQACIYFKLSVPESSAPHSQSLPIPQQTSPPQTGRLFPPPNSYESPGYKSPVNATPSGPSPHAPEFRPPGTPLSAVVMPSIGARSLGKVPFSQPQRPIMVPQPSYSISPGLPKDRIFDEGRLQCRRYLERVMKKYEPSDLEFKTITRDFPPHGRYYKGAVYSAYHKRTIMGQDWHLIPEEAEDDAAECLLAMMELLELPSPRAAAAVPDYGRPRTMQESQRTGPIEYQAASTPQENTAETRGSFPGPTVLPTSMSEIEPELTELISNIKKIHFPPPAPRPRMQTNFDGEDDTDQPLFVDQ